MQQCPRFININLVIVVVVVHVVVVVVEAIWRFGGLI